MTNAGQITPSREEVPSEFNMINTPDASDSSGFRGETTLLNLPWVENGVIVRAPTQEDLDHQKSIQNVGTEQDAQLELPIEPKRGFVKRAIGSLGLQTFTSERPEDDSLLGNKRFSKSRASQPEATGDFGFGNEVERLRVFRKMPFSTFKERLITINNSLRKKGIDDAKGDEGFTTSGRLAGSSHNVAHIYPDAKDVDELMAYAFDEAKKNDDIQMSALIISAGLVAIHPFSDGNGRLSRAVYGELSGGLTSGNAGHNLLTASSSLSKEEDGGARMVNVGTSVLEQDQTLAQIHKEAIYSASGIERLDVKPISGNYEKNQNGKFTGLSASALEGLDLDEKLWLEDLYRNVRGIDYTYEKVLENGSEHESFKYAVSYAASKDEGVAHAVSGLIQHHEGKIAVDHLFNSTNVELKKLLAEGVRSYYKQYARAFIDMVGAGGDREIIGNNGVERMSVRDRIIELSNNFLSEKIRNKSKPLAGKLSI